MTATVVNAVTAVSILGCSLINPSLAPPSPLEQLVEKTLRDSGPAFDKFDDHGATAFVFVVDSGREATFITPPKGFAKKEVEPFSFPDGLTRGPVFTNSQCDIRVFWLKDASKYPRRLPDEVRSGEKKLIHVLFQCQSE